MRARELDGENVGELEGDLGRASKRPGVRELEGDGAKELDGRISERPQENLDTE